VSFLDFYHLREQPFGVTPDPAYLYPSQTHREALASLSAGIKEDRGFMALIAEPGMGKTTLLYQLLEEWRNSARTVFLFQTQCDSREFFRYVLGELGIDAEQLGLAAMHYKLNAILFDEMIARKRFILVVDEAQNLNDSVLETVRLLSNFETPHAKLLQIVLAGQPQLTGKLAQPRLAQLRQRIAVLSHLAPLTVAETDGYVQHRLTVAGYSGEPLFTPDALELIAQRSQGIPRNINNICYNSLSVAHLQGCPRVTSEIVQRVVGQLLVESVAPQSSAMASRTVIPIADGDLRPMSALHPETAPRLTYTPATQSDLARWAFAGALLTVLFLGGLFLIRSYPRSAEPQQNSPNSSAPLNRSNSSEIMPGTYTAEPEDTDSGQVLTVVVKPGQTLEEIGLLYTGHFDPQLARDICAINPELKDPAHIETGQLIRLPLLENIAAPDRTANRRHGNDAIENRPSIHPGGTNAEHDARIQQRRDERRRATN
jgi:type II secretory pathway predicted ATPase ExeA